MNKFIFRVQLLGLALVVGLALVPGVYAQRGSQIIVKYRSAIEARKILSSFASAPQTFSIGGRSARIASTYHAGGASSFPKENFVTMSLADAASAQATLDVLKTDPNVEYAQLNNRHHIDGVTALRTTTSPKKKSNSLAQSFVPNDSAYASQWNLAMVGMPAAWEIEKGDPNVLIAFIDTGIDWDHDDFYSPAGILASVHVNPAEDINQDGLFEPWSNDTSIMYRGAMRTGDLDGIDQDGNGEVDDVIGYDFVDQDVANIGDWSGRDPIPFDENSHGTAITGVLAASTNNKIGVAGVAFGCKVLPVRAFDATGNGEDDDIAAGIIYAADFSSSDGAHVRVINLSFGDVIASPIMHDAISYAKQKGIVIVCSSGNNGGTGAHYPSSYPECISVGATDEDDLVVGTSGGGNSIALVAPGADIPTTIPGNAYSPESGTSVAAPHVAAAAALLFSHTPSLSADDVRGILQTTSDDIGSPGWDSRAGAGRLNVAAALQSFAASVQLLSPKQDDEFATDTIPIVGTAALPFFSFYRVFVGAGTDPTKWTLIRDTTRRQVLNDTLMVWNAAGQPDGSYVVRLVVNTSDNKTIEARSHIDLERAAPVATLGTLSDILASDHHAILVSARSDQLTTFVVKYRVRGPLGAFSEKKQIDRFTHNHFVILDVADVTAGVPYEMYCEVTNAAGTVTRLDSAGAPFVVARSAEAFPTTPFVQKQYALNGSVLLNATADFFGDNGKCVAALDENSNGGVLRIAEFRNGAFTTRDSILSMYNPRGIGNTKSDGLLQIWSQSGVSSKLWTQTATHTSPLHAIAFADTTEDMRAAGMADLDGDGTDELIAMSGSSIVIFKYQSGTYRVMARLPNPTPPGPDQDSNYFSYPSIAVGDFDGDGQKDLLVGDADADFYIYSFNSSLGFVNTFTDLNAGEDAFVAAGDFNGDGKPDFAVAFHTPLAWNADREYDTPYWTLKVFTSDKPRHYVNAWSTNISVVRPPSTYRGGMASGDLDGIAGDELFVNTFPNSYVFKWDAARGAMAPMHYFPFGASNTAIIADFDGNHVNELGFYTGGETDFFEYDASRATPPTPVNLSAVPTDSSHALLKWNAVPNAIRYLIYRGKFLPSDPTVQMDLVARTTSPQFSDSLLSSRSWYDYAVADSGANGISVPTPSIAVFTHAVPDIKAIPPQSSSIGLEIHFTELIPATPVQPGVFSDNFNGTPSSVITAGDSGLKLIWHAPLKIGDHQLQINGLVDRYGLAIPHLTAKFKVVLAVLPDSFYIVHSAVPDPHHIVLQFSCEVDSADAKNLSHYSIAPTGTIIAAMRDTTDHTKIILTLDNAVPIGAFGKTWTVHVTGLQSTSCGAIVEGAGSSAGIELHREDLSAMFVYPNPCRMDANEHCTFANLTPKADITIFTISGAKVATLTEQNGDGGADWNFRDLRGDQVGSGVYLYIAHGKNSAGDDVEPKVGKFALVR